MGNGLAYTQHNVAWSCEHAHTIISLQAGLITPTTTKQLIIALEPEAASIYCRKLRLRECIPDPVPSLSVSPALSPSTGAPKFSLAGSHSTSKSYLTPSGGTLSPFLFCVLIVWISGWLGAATVP